MVCAGLRQASAVRPAVAHESRPQAGESSGMIYVADCNLGRGVFANRAIQEGEIVLAFKSAPWAEAARLTIMHRYAVTSPAGSGSILPCARAPKTSLLQLASRPNATYHSKDV